MSSYSKTYGTIEYEEIPLTNDDWIVRHRWLQTATSLEDFKDLAPTLPGYDLVITVNGGGFGRDSNNDFAPHGSMQRFDGVGQWTEDGNPDLLYYWNNCEDIAIKNDRICKHTVEGLQSNPASEGFQLIRGEYEFDIFTDTDGVLKIRPSQQFGENSSIVGNTIILESSYRTGFAFKGDDPYLIVTKSKLIGETLKNLLSAKGFTSYVNMDGGKSTGLIIADEEVKAPERYLHEVFYVYKKSPKTFRSLLTNPSMSNNRYPTRATYNGAYNPNSYFINTGDTVEITDMKIDGSDIVCEIGRIFDANGTVVESFSGRWFAYDKDNFD